MLAKRYTDLRRTLGKRDGGYADYRRTLGKRAKSYADYRRTLGGTRAENFLNYNIDMDEEADDHLLANDYMEK